MDVFLFYVMIFLLIVTFLKINFYSSDNNEDQEEYNTLTFSANELVREIEYIKNMYFTASMADRLKKKYSKTYNEIMNIRSSKLNGDLINKFKMIYSDLDSFRQKHNKAFISKELLESSDLLSNIDGKSLDKQQRLAVVTDEDSNLVIAGAGSGKTLTIAAKVKYLVEKKGIKPEKILLISFTSKSSQEMRERIANKLNINVDVKTFHKLGLGIIANARNYKPDIVDDVFLSKLINTYLKKEILNKQNGISTVLLFMSYYLCIPKDISFNEGFDDYSLEAKTMNLETIRSKMSSYRTEDRIKEMTRNHDTFKGEKVKSIEEVIIANYLYLNGIDYIYENKYPYENGDVYHKVYRPDFYLPEYDLYLEHFGITEDYKVPWLDEKEEKKYIEGIKWKRNLHKFYGTTLLETYSYYNKKGSLLIELERILCEHNVVFKKRNIEEIYRQIYIENDDRLFSELKKLIISFINLYKSNGYDISEFRAMKEKAHKIESSFLRDRMILFLEMIEPIYAFYQEKLSEQNRIDFNDMINEATSLIENGEIFLDYQYIIIDEYQDIAMSRFKLVNAIRKKCNSKLMCVGDDWQSIYRFAGSDINLFTKFGDYVGYYELLKIEKTYRNSQELIDIASKFITKNPNQIKKKLLSDKHQEKPIRIIGAERSFIQPQLDGIIEEIVEQNGEDTNIMIVCRNNFDFDILYKSDFSNKLPRQEKLLQLKRNNNDLQLECNKYPNLNISLLTAHKSKGLEADNVIIINLENKLTGFPNKISDDPVLSFVLTDSSSYEFDEERRLFYVAITRTKKCTYLLTNLKNKSAFVKELEKDNLININEADEKTDESPKCPKCKSGYLEVRKDRKHSFLGCTNHPICNYSLENLNIINNRIICPNCNGYIIKRIGKNGVYLSCDNYPACRYIVDLEYTEKQDNSDFKSKSSATTIYQYCGVALNNYSKVYHYIAEDKTLTIGDRVIVPVGENNEEKEGIIETVGFYTDRTVPFPVNKTKRIIRKI